MNTEPISIDSVAGPIVVTTNAFRAHPVVTVSGVPAPRTGGHQYALPAAGGGAVEATVRSAFADPYPTVEVNGVRHRTGPSVPAVLRVMTLLPILLMVAVGGALGGLIGALGFVVNVGAVTRIQTPTAVKALIMVGVSAAAFVLWFAVAVVVTAAFGLD